MRHSLSRWICTALLACTITVAEAEDFHDLEPSLTCKGVLRSPGRFGNGFLLDGESQRLALGGGIGVPAKFALECWIRPDRLGSKTTLFSSRAWQKCQLVMSDSGMILSYKDKASRSIGHYASYRFEVGSWYHVVVSFSPEKGARFYVNGKLAGFSAPNQPVPVNMDVNVVGAYHIDGRGNCKDFFKGMIDRPRIWKRDLSAEEISDLYSQGTVDLPVIPLVQQAHRMEGEAFDAGDKVDLYVSDSLLQKDDAGVVELTEQLKKSGTQVSLIKEIKGYSSVAAIAICKPSEPLAKRLLRHAPVKELPAKDGYTIIAKKRLVAIIAQTPQSAFYGVQTLKQMLARGKQIAAMQIWDYPEFPFRGYLVVDDVKPPIRLSDGLRARIRELAALKFNHLVIRSHSWVVLDRPDVKTAMQEVVDYAGKYHMNVVPNPQCYSHAKGFLWDDLRTGHTNTIKKEEVKLSGQTPVALKRPNVVVTKNTPIIVTDTKGNVLAEGKDYTIIPGALKATYGGHPKSERWPWARPYVPKDNAPTKIQRMDGGRIKDGQSILVTYDVASGQETTCSFSEYTWSRLEDCVRESLAMTGSDYIHLGMDEIWVIRGAGRCCSGKQMSDEETTVFTMNKGYEVCQKVKPGVQVMLWSDMLDKEASPSWHHPLNESELLKLFAEGKLNRDIIMMPWSYGTWHTLIDNFVGFLARNGFAIAGTPGHLYYCNTVWTDVMMHHRAGGARIPGAIYAPWSTGDSKRKMEGIHGSAHGLWNGSPFRLNACVQLQNYLTHLGVKPESTPEQMDAIAAEINSRGSSVFRQELMRRISEAERSAGGLNPAVISATNDKHLEMLMQSIEQARRLLGLLK